MGEALHGGRQRGLARLTSPEAGVPEPPPPVVLTIAGSDSGGEAGLQADLKTFTALGVFGASAITAVTAQNTREVRAVFVIPPGLLTAQVEAVLDDLHPGAVKTGRLFDAPSMLVVASLLRQAAALPLVLDPVAVDSRGRTLLDDGCRAVLRSELLPLAEVVTPSRREGEILTGKRVESTSEVEVCLRVLHDLGARHVLLKDADSSGDEAVDWLFDGTTLRRLAGPRTREDFAHGAGDTLSAAIAAFLARGLPPAQACVQGWAFTRQALARGQRPGGGRGTPGQLAATSN